MYFSGGPLEALDETVFGEREYGFVGVTGESVVHEKVGAVGGRSEGPDRPAG